MNKTKKGLLVAGTIIFIVEACLLVALGAILVAAAGILDFGVVQDMLTEAGLYFTEEEAENILKFGKTTCILLGIAIIVGALSMSIVAVLLLNSSKNGKYSKKLNITMLVFSILIGDILVMAFMIAGLAIKDEKPTLENIKEIGEKHNISKENPPEQIEDVVEEIKEDKK